MISLIITAIKGINVDLVYGEGVTISVTEKDEIKTEDAEEIASNTWSKGDYLIQKAEYFNDGIIIKVKEVSDEQLEKLVNLFNEKYEKKISLSDIVTEHVSNVKLLSLVEPYIMPVGLSTLLILAYYAVRYRGAKRMIIAIGNLIIAGSILYCIYAVGRIKVDLITMPLALSTYIVTLAITTAKFELTDKKEE